jgi:hypothetical protein
MLWFLAGFRLPVSRLTEEYPSISSFLRMVFIRAYRGARDGRIRTSDLPVRSGNHQPTAPVRQRTVMAFLAALPLSYVSAILSAGVGMRGFEPPACSCQMITISQRPLWGKNGDGRFAALPLSYIPMRAVLYFIVASANRSTPSVEPGASHRQVWRRQDSNLHTIFGTPFEGNHRPTAPPGQGKGDDFCASANSATSPYRVLGAGIEPAASTSSRWRCYHAELPKQVYFRPLRKRGDSNPQDALAS